MTNHPSSIKPFNGLQWHRIKAAFINIRSSGLVKEHPVSIINAIIKGVTARLDGSLDNDDPHVFFHITERRFNAPKRKVREGDKIPVECVIVRRDAAYAEKWKDALSDYLDDAQTGKNFKLAAVPAVEDRSFERLCAEAPLLKAGGEICLDFQTPIPFGRRKGRDRTLLSSADFVKAFTSRFSKLFHVDFPSPPTVGFQVLPYYWQYNEMRHVSKSQTGAQFINGCVGRLYIKGDIKELLPFLILGAELHAGGKTQNAQGFYVLDADPPPHFAGAFPRKSGVLAALRDTLERYDNAFAALAAEEGAGFSEDSCVDKLYNSLLDGAYAASPSIAFLVKKKDGSDRLIEQLPFRDMIIQRYLYKTVSEAFDRAFEETSIGFRKGASRMTAIERVREAVAGGYEYVLESDVHDFFPSIDRAVLKERLGELLPCKDVLIKDLLMKAVSSGYVLNGEYVARPKGLPQGSPLSPLLANVMLDRFDEQMQSSGARLVRYADDFIIMTKTSEEAEALLSKCESVLAGLGLGIRKDKTSIRRISDGFEFLGITFAGGEADVESEEEFARRLKKPLYVTEPYIFLALSADSIEARKDGKILETLPLRRISEIMVMEKTVF